MKLSIDVRAKACRSRNSAIAVRNKLVARVARRPHHAFDRAVEVEGGLRGVGLRLEHRVVLERGAAVLEVVLEGPVVLVERAARFAEGALHERLGDVLDHGVQAEQRVVHVEADERLARRRQAEAAEELHGQHFLHHRRVLGEVVEDERAQAEEAAVGGVAIEAEQQAGLDVAAAAEAARAHADILLAQAAPGELRGVERVLPERGFQLLPVAGVHEQAQVLHGRGIEQVVHGLRRGAPRRRRPRA
jgi:hypothetical protein